MTARAVAILAEKLTGRMMARAIDPFRRALRQQVLGNPAGDEWAEIAGIWERQLLASMLLGRAQQARRLVRSRVIEKPVQEPIRSLDEIAVFDDDDIARRSLQRSAVEIINQFLGEIPDLRRVAGTTAQTAQEHARRLTIATQDQAPALLRRIVERIPQAVTTAPEGLPDPVQIVGRLLDDDAGSRLLSSTLETEARTSMMQGFNQAGRAEIVRHSSLLPITVLSEIQDRRTRGNPRGLYPHARMHYQMDGFAAATDDPIWDRITPPNGYNCRGSVRGMTNAEARQKQWLTSDGDVDREALRRRFARQWRILERGEYPDDGFG